MDHNRQSSSSTQNSNPIAQAFQQLSTDLQSGNLTAAQQDYSNLQQDFQNQAAQRPHHHHHSSGSQDNSAISQLFSQIGQELQSGDLTSAQQAYTTLQQDLQQYALSHGALNGVASSSVSETALSSSHSLPARADCGSARVAYYRRFESQSHSINQNIV